MAIYAIYDKRPDGTKELRELRKAYNRQAAHSAAAAATIEAVAIGSEEVAEILSSGRAILVTDEQVGGAA